MTLPQGDLGLLETAAAQRLLASTTLARLAYTGLDDKPRAVPIWFHWNGEEVVMASDHEAPKGRALRARPDAAVTIDTETFPYDALLVRGAASVTDHEGWVPEYLESARRYLGEEGAAQLVASFEGREMRMHRIAVRPSWVGLLDFKLRFPAGFGGVQG